LIVELPHGPGFCQLAIAMRMCRNVRFGHLQLRLGLAADVQFNLGSDRIEHIEYRPHRSGKPAPPYTIAA
jgi:hypothetical protein